MAIHRISSTRVALIAAVLTLGLIGPGLTKASAQSGITYVSAGGADTNTCDIPTAACRTFDGALAKTTDSGTIVCVNAGYYYPTHIDRSITIDCLEGGGGNNTISVQINAPGKYVRLRNLALNGFGFQTNVIDIVAAKSVHIENVLVTGSPSKGIYDHRIGGQTRLYITDTVVSNNGGPGIALGSQGPNTNVLDNVRSENNVYGIAAAAGNNVLINRSVFSGNSTAGIEGDSGAQIAVNNSTISHNEIGVQSIGSVRLSNNDIAFNSFAISGPSGTFGNNRFSGNSSIGTAPTAIGGATSDLGQQ